MKKKKKRKVRMGIGIFVLFAGVLLSCFIWKDHIQEHLKVRAFRMAIESRSEEQFRKCFDKLVRFDESTGTLIPKTEFIRTGMNEAYLAAMRNWLETGTPLFGEDPFDERMVFFLVGFCSSPSRGGFGYGESPNGFELCNAVVEKCRLHGIPAGRKTWTIQRNEDGTVSFRLGAQFE